MTKTDILWATCFVMALAAGAFIVIGRGRRTRDEENHWIAHFIVPILASLAYLGMATGQGELTLGDGRTFYFARYLDWSVTTPLLLLGLMLTSLKSPFRRWAVVLGVIGADIIMVVTGAFADASTHASAVKWIWYTISCGAFFFVYMALYGTLSREAAKDGPETASVFGTNRNILAVLWLIYPIVWAFGPEGVGSLSGTGSIAAYAALDVLTKVVYGAFALRQTAKLTTLEIAGRRVADADLRTAPAVYAEAHMVVAPEPAH